MVKKPVRANFQIKATAVTATANNSAPSSSNQRWQPLRPAYTSHAPHPKPGGPDPVRAGFSDFLTIRGDPEGQAATVAQAIFILRPVAYPELHLRNVMAALGVEFFGHAVSQFDE